MVSYRPEHGFPNRMNPHFAGVTTSFYIPLWNGMICNAFIEWAGAGMPGTAAEAVENVHASLKQLAESIGACLRSKTQHTQP